MHQIDHSAFVSIESSFPAKQPKKENEEEENEEDIIELPEFTKTLSKKQSFIAKEKVNTTNGNGDKAAEVKVSEATTAVQEQQNQQKQNIEAKIAS